RSFVSYVVYFNHYAIPPSFLRFFLVRFLARIIFSASTASSVKLLLRYHVHTATTAVATDDTPSNISSSENGNGFHPIVTSAWLTTRTTSTISRTIAACFPF